MGPIQPGNDWEWELGSIGCSDDQDKKYSVRVCVFLLVQLLSYGRASAAASI